MYLYLEKNANLPIYWADTNRGGSIVEDVPALRAIPVYFYLLPVAFSTRHTPFALPRRREAKLPRVSRNLLKLLIDEDGPTVQVYTIPGQAADLAAPQASEQRYQIENFKAVSLDSFHKGPDCIIIQRLGVLPLGFRQFTGSRRIRVQIAYRNCLLQSLVKNPVDALNCFG